MSPIIEMDGGDIQACGARAMFTEPRGTFDLLLKKSEQGPRLQIRASFPTVPVTAVSVKTATVEDREVLATEFVDGGTVVRDGDANSPAATSFLQQYFVSGASVSLHLRGGTTQTLAVAGPAANSVRQAYLNCAGDFYR
jgi:hypothetical protein